MSKKELISVRLSEEVSKKCKLAAAKGYTRSDFINQAILNIPIYNRGFEQKLLPYFCSIAESIASIQGNNELKIELRKELDAVCQYLNSQPDGI